MVVSHIARSSCLSFQHLISILAQWPYVTSSLSGARSATKMAAHSLPLAQACSTRSLKQLLNDLTKLYIANRTRVSRTIYVALFLLISTRIRNAIKEQKAAAAEARSRRAAGLKAEGTGGRKKVELNREFFRNVGKLLRICMPGWRSTEVRILGSYSVFLVLRTLLSLYVAELDGRLVSSLVKGRGKEFAKGLVWWMIVAVPATFTNSMVSFPISV